MVNQSEDAPHVVLNVRIEELHRPSALGRWEAAKHQNARIIRDERFKWVVFNVHDDVCVCFGAQKYSKIFTVQTILDRCLYAHEKRVILQSSFIIVSDIDECRERS